MRPPRVSLNVIRYPLDDILAAPAHVRLLRVLLFELDAVVSVTDAARVSGLSDAGARKAFVMLEHAGVVVRVGSGRAIKYGLAQGNPFLSLLRELFEREHEQYQGLIQSLRSAIELPETREAWVRELPLGSRRTIDIDVVALVKAVSWIANEIRSRLMEIEKKWNIIVELHVHTRADLLEIPANAIMLWTSGQIIGTDHSTRPKTLVESEERSHRMAQAIAGMLERDPTLKKRALRYIHQLLREGQGMADRDLEEWRQLLESYSTARLRDLLISESPRALRLRRSMPFYPVLTDEERIRVQEHMEATS
ncbi:MAG: hypothetical protein WAV84_14855 [Bacteroidota bacterium]